VGRVNVPVPPCVLEKLRNPALDASASAAMATASIHPTPSLESVTLDVEAADDAAAFES
jgi:glutamine amidotransferase